MQSLFTEDLFGANTHVRKNVVMKERPNEWLQNTKLLKKFPIEEGSNDGEVFSCMQSLFTYARKKESGNERMTK